MLERKMRCTNLVAKGIDGSNSVVDKIFDQTFIVQDIAKESCREVIFESALFLRKRENLDFDWLYLPDNWSVILK